MLPEKSNNTLLKFSQYCFFAVLISVPVFITKSDGNPFYLSKNDALMLFGGLFILSALILIYNKFSGRDEHWIFIDKKLDPFVLIFFLSAAAASIFSINPQVSYSGYYLRPLGLQVFIFIFIIYFFSASVIRNRTDALKTLYIMEICAVCISVYSILQYLGIDPAGMQMVKDQRPPGTFGNAVFLGGFLVLALPFSAIRQIEKRKISFTTLFPVLILTSIIISQTRSAYAAVIVQSITILLFYPLVKKSRDKAKKGYLKYILLISFSVILILVFLAMFARSNIFVKRFFEITSIFDNARWLLWRDSLKIFYMYPITGSGISTFPNVFENVYTIEFKLHDVRGFYDHAHSNYIHTLCTMGLIGIISYLTLLFHTMTVLYKTVASTNIKREKKIIYFGFLAMLTGYMVYGIADFDETSILFYLFIYFAVLKVLFKNDFQPLPFKIISVFNRLGKPVFIVFSIIIIFYSGYNIYSNFKHDRAVYYFSKAYKSHMQYDFQTSFDNFALALENWDENSYFHFEYGGALLDYVIGAPNLTLQNKTIFVNKAKEEFKTAIDGFYSRTENLKLISLADFVIGDTIEAEQIKNQLLDRDSLMINYRVSLAEYYITKNYYSNAKEQLLFCSKYLPGYPLIFNLTMTLLKDKNFPEPDLFCRQMLAIDPSNEPAKQYLKSRH